VRIQSNYSYRNYEHILINTIYFNVNLI